MRKFYEKGKRYIIYGTLLSAFLLNLFFLVGSLEAEVNGNGANTNMRAEDLIYKYLPDEPD